MLLLILVAATALNVHPTLGQRHRVTVQEGAPKKLRKKVRRSKSPQLYPAITHSGTQCWVRLNPAQAHLAVPNGTMECTVVEDDGEVVVSPLISYVVKRDAEKLPEGARLLSDLRVGEKVDATVLRFLGPNIALVSVPGAYRLGKDRKHHRLNAVLKKTDAKVGATLKTYVRFAEPNSGRLTLSLDPVSKEDLKRERYLNRIRKQIRKGSLRPGCKRIATVIDVNERNATVDAGGLVGFVGLDERDVGAGDNVGVRVMALDPRTAEATLELLPEDFDIYSPADDKLHDLDLLLDRIAS